MDKHAYCIIAHKDDYVFKALLKTIDDSRNDIFVLVDKKSKQFDIPQIQKICKKSEIIFIPQIKVYDNNDDENDDTTNKQVKSPRRRKKMKKSTKNRKNKKQNSHKTARGSLCQLQRLRRG